MSKQTVSIPVPSESEFQIQILKALAADPRRGLFWRQNAGVVVQEATRSARRRVFRGAPKGAADIVGVAAGGIHVEIEVKVTAAWTVAQYEWRKRVEALGGVYVLVRYDDTVWPAQNVRRALEAVDEAIQARVQTQVTEVSDE